jgi:hypothetical protein
MFTRTDAMASVKVGHDEFIVIDHVHSHNVRRNNVAPSRDPPHLQKRAKFFDVSFFFLFFFIKKATEPATTIVLSSDEFHDDVLPSLPLAGAFGSGD